MKVKSEIAVILNKYKNILNDLIYNSDIKFSDDLDTLNWPRLIDKWLRNMLKSRGSLSTFLEKNCLDEDISVTSLELASKI